MANGAAGSGLGRPPAGAPGPALAAAGLAKGPPAGVVGCCFAAGGGGDPPAGTGPSIGTEPPAGVVGCCFAAGEAGDPPADRVTGVAGTGPGFGRGPPAVTGLNSCSGCAVEDGGGAAVALPASAPFCLASGARLEAALGAACGCTGVDLAAASADLASWPEAVEATACRSASLESHFAFLNANGPAFYSSHHLACHQSIAKTTRVLLIALVSCQNF